jgi:hypothetical protein
MGLVSLTKCHSEELCDEESGEGLAPPPQILRFAQHDILFILLGTLNARPFLAVGQVLLSLEAVKVGKEIPQSAFIKGACSLAAESLRCGQNVSGEPGQLFHLVG